MSQARTPRQQRAEINTKHRSLRTAIRCPLCFASDHVEHEDVPNGELHWTETPGGLGYGFGPGSAE